jgi:RNA polymerase sigma-70 factor (ECF subfamily)
LATELTTAAHETFQRERRRLLSIAYGLLGSLAEAEDVVQEAYLRLEGADFAAIREPAAWLTTVVSRLALDQLKSARRRRETYPGEWLPEPVFDAPPAEQRAITRSRLSLGFLHLMEKLKPEERAVFVLREVFEHPYGDIAEMLGKSDAACRQMMTRARSRLGGGEAASPDASSETLTGRFLDALEAGDEQRLMSLLAPDAVFYGDGGGKVRAVVNPVYGAEKIVRFFQGIARKYPGRFQRSIIAVNGEPGMRTLVDGKLNGVAAIEWKDGRIAAIYNVLNPEKLHAHPDGRASVAGERTPG